MNIYTSLIIDLSKYPVNRRKISGPAITASGANVTCGDRLRMYAKLDARGGVSDCSFEGEGCAISMASASLLTEEAKGKTPEEILQWGALQVFGWLGVELGGSRIKCGLLALETLQTGLKTIPTPRISIVPSKTPLDSFQKSSSKHHPANQDRE